MVDVMFVWKTERNNVMDVMLVALEYEIKQNGER